MSKSIKFQVGYRFQEASVEHINDIWVSPGDWIGDTDDKTFQRTSEETADKQEPIVQRVGKNSFARH